MGEAATESRIRCDIDFDRAGRQASYLRAPLVAQHVRLGHRRDPDHRREERLRADGPVHGRRPRRRIRRPDRRLSAGAARWIRQQIQGRVIMMPAVNVPAVMNDTRLSPVDDRDLNRCFPGDPRGTFSEMLAHFWTAWCCRTSTSRSTCTRPAIPATRPLDQHALSSRMPRCGRRRWRPRPRSARRYNVVFWGVDEGATLTSCVERRGIISLGTELGGWGRVNIEGVRIGERGLRNVLKHFGLIEGSPRRASATVRPATRHMMVQATQSCYSFAPAAACSSRGTSSAKRVGGRMCRVPAFRRGYRPPADRGSLRAQTAFSGWRPVRAASSAATSSPSS